MIKNLLLTGLISLAAFQGFAQDDREPAIPEMITIEGGSFWMGNDYTFNTMGASDEAPEHKVTVNSFKLSKTEVTFALFDRFCDATGYSKPNDGNKGRAENFPVYNVSWEAAVMFCNWLSSTEHIEKYYTIKRDSLSFTVSTNEGAKGYRLPTEAEWEYAARGGANAKTFSYSGSNKADDVAWYKGNSQLSPHDVGTRQPNALGIHDMSGNVWEWCYDYYNKDYYKSSPESNPKGPDKGADRVYRGGCWTSGYDDLRMTSRHSFSQNKEYGMIGIRLAQNL